jgi:eukaryotic-like serine/threonine-protein kinase
MEQLLDALQHAHRNNVVHRDIKPANLLVGEDGQLQVADFGIAKIDLAGLTRSGQVLGTPAYMSPEQCQGTPSDPGRISSRRGSSSMSC